MSVYENIENLSIRLSENEPERIAKRIKLYFSGVSAKLRNAEYALARLKELSPQSDVTSSDDSDFLISQQISFYVDSFFAFLYSSFDVIAQVINQKLRIGENEKAVSIKRIKRKIDDNHTGVAIQPILNDLLRSNFFKNLDKYRNCSTHRRQIYIQEKTVTISATPGYSTTGDMTSVERLLCDDPLLLNPTVRQERILVDYCNRMLVRSKNEISNIANNIQRR